ncbi:MAG: cytochrome b N-terminal domain-containing protein [Coriobacteriia bacterium]|nr:cytochrome b N-terminal domain-containing protein [Coriobacteriia bacterium]
MSDEAEGTDTPRSPWPSLGELAIAALALQAVTGAVMAFAYQPTPDHAYASTYAIVHLMNYGWLVRTIHSWGAFVLTAIVAAHAFRAFLAAAHKHPGERTWVLGALSGLTAVALGFAGRLLPWDQTAYWSTEEALSLLRQLPYAGGTIARALIGGDALGATTLTRFHAAHVTLLPAALAGLLVAHVWSARSTRRSADAIPTATVARRAAMLRAATATASLLCLYAVLAIVRPVPLELVADPAVAPAQTGPALPFLLQYGLGRYLPDAVAATVPVALVALFIAVPFIDRGPSRAPRDRIAAIAIGSVGAAAVIAFVVLGALR